MPSKIRAAGGCRRCRSHVGHALRACLAGAQRTIGPSPRPLPVVDGTRQAGTTRPAGPNKIRAAGGCRRPSCKRFAVKPCDWILVKGRFGRACLVGQVGWLARWEPDRSPPFAPLTGSAVGEGESIAEYGSKQHANVDPRLCSRDRLPTSHVRPGSSPPGDAMPVLPAIPASGRPGLAGRPGASRSLHARITSARRADGTMKTLPHRSRVPVAASPPKGCGALFAGPPSGRFHPDRPLRAFLPVLACSANNQL